MRINFRSLHTLVSALSCLFIISCGDSESGSDNNNWNDNTPYWSEDLDSTDYNDVEPVSDSEEFQPCPSTLNEVFSFWGMSKVNNLQTIADGIYFFTTLNDLDIMSDNFFSSDYSSDLLKKTYTNSDQILSKYSEADVNAMVQAWSINLKYQSLKDRQDELQEFIEMYTKEIKDLEHKGLTSEMPSITTEYLGLASSFKLKRTDIEKQKIEVKKEIDNMKTNYTTDIEPHTMVAVKEFDGKCVVDIITADSNFGSGKEALKASRVINNDKKINY